MLNKKGEFVLSFTLILTMVVGIASLGFYKTYKDGTLKQNGKKIWCKVMNNGEQVCNERYPSVVEVAENGS